MEQVRDLSSMKLLSDILPDRVGSLLSINSIKEDLDVSHRAVTNWLNILESLYYHFRIYPYAGSAIRSLKKEPKLFLWDWSEVSEPGARFENLIASHLLKWVHFLSDNEGYKAELYYIRDVDGYRRYIVFRFEPPELGHVRRLKFRRLPASWVPAEYLHRVAAEGSRPIERLVYISGY